MNMAPPLMKLGYERIVNDIHPFYLQAAEKSMRKA